MVRTSFLLTRNAMSRLASLPFLFLFPVLACAGADASGTAVERIDSAGVEHVLNTAPDRPLDWRFERVLTLGGVDEGPQAFGGIGTVAADAAGRIYVPDGGAFRIRVFDETGAQVRAMGGEGGGPGEFRFLAAFDVAPDGTALVFDIGKGSIVVFDSLGNALPERKLPTYPTNRLRAIGAGIAAVFNSFGAEAGDTTRARLLVLGDGDSTEIASIPVQRRGEFVQLPRCPIGLNVPPLLAPDIEWDATARRIIVSQGTEYILDVWEPRAGTWRPRRSIRRTLPPIAGTVEVAAAEYPDSFRIRAGPNLCAVGPTEIAETLGFADVAPHIRDVLLAPDGSVWVSHRIGTERGTDVFSADGEYLGTLPADAPFPAAFRGEDEILTLEKDEFDRTLVVLWRVLRD